MPKKTVQIWKEERFFPTYSAYYYREEELRRVFTAGTYFMGNSEYLISSIEFIKDGEIKHERFKIVNSIDQATKEAYNLARMAAHRIHKNKKANEIEDCTRHGFRPSRSRNLSKRFRRDEEL